MDSYKNRELLEIGTRVMLAYDRISTRVGTVMYHDDGRMAVIWDGNNLPGYFYPAEIRIAKEENA